MVLKEFQDRPCGLGKQDGHIYVHPVMQSATLYEIVLWYGPTGAVPGRSEHMRPCVAHHQLLKMSAGGGDSTHGELHDSILAGSYILSYGPKDEYIAAETG